MKTGFLKRHTRPKADLLLTTEKTEFILGEDLVGNLEVRAEEEFEVEEVRIGVVQEPGNRITECLRIYPRNSHSHFSAGSSQKLPFCFTTPTGTQEDQPNVEKRIRSNLTVVVRIKGRGSISRNLEIVLVKPART